MEQMEKESPCEFNRRICIIREWGRKWDELAEKYEGVLQKGGFIKLYKKRTMEVCQQIDKDGIKDESLSLLEQIQIKNMNKEYMEALKYL
jgi:hypothetical protein